MFAHRGMIEELDVSKVGWRKRFNVVRVASFNIGAASFLAGVILNDKNDKLNCTTSSTSSLLRSPARRRPAQPLITLLFTVQRENTCSGCSPSASRARRPPKGRPCRSEPRGC